MSKPTRQKLCEAAIDLFSQEGYDGVTTKKIAEVAGVSEMTLFRHFGSKTNLFQDAYDTYLYQPNFESLFQTGLKGDLEKDLLRIGHVYLDVLNMNKSLIMMEIRSQSQDSQERPPLTKAPRLFKNQMIKYLDQLRKKGEIKDENPELIAVAFISSILGHFFRETVCHGTITDINAQEGIEYSIKMFAKSISIS
ncbi:TetR/AcrR family transcriptional regulator [Fusibacter sp. JL216-2]|uniref:TetR/AcrR family transcriptional regulator n=1 Tax=Fusibacter sp. JL216-2 TaxID=3071453 RepID=UPI003D33194C